MLEDPAILTLNIRRIRQILINELAAKYVDCHPRLYDVGTKPEIISLDVNIF